MCIPVRIVAIRRAFSGNPVRKSPLIGLRWGGVKNPPKRGFPGGANLGPRAPAPSKKYIFRDGGVPPALGSFFWEDKKSARQGLFGASGGLLKNPQK